MARFVFLCATQLTCIGSTRFMFYGSCGFVSVWHLPPTPSLFPSSSGSLQCLAWMRPWPASRSLHSAMPVPILQADSPLSARWTGKRVALCSTRCSAAGFLSFRSCRQSFACGRLWYRHAGRLYVTICSMLPVVPSCLPWRMGTAWYSGMNLFCFCWSMFSTFSFVSLATGIIEESTRKSICAEPMEKSSKPRVTISRIYWPRTRSRAASRISRMKGQSKLRSMKFSLRAERVLMDHSNKQNKIQRSHFTKSECGD